MDIKRINDRFSVSAQPAPGDLKKVAEQGFAAVVCNRPDGEQAGQPGSEEIGQAAQDAGMAFHYLPVPAGQAPDERTVAAFGKIRSETDGKVYGYCRTGTRSATLNVLSNPDGVSADERLQQAREAGYDLSALRGRLGE